MRLFKRMIKLGKVLLPKILKLKTNRSHLIRRFKKLKIKVKIMIIQINKMMLRRKLQIRLLVNNMYKKKE